MSPREAWLFAASWGSLIGDGSDGDGPAMYGYSEDCRPQHEAHRAASLRHIEDCLAIVAESPQHYNKTEPRKLRQLRRYLSTAPLKEPTPATT